MHDQGVDPSAITALATGYWNSATLLAAVDLDLFSALADGSRSAAQVALSLDSDPRATTLLLDAVVGLGLLEKDATGIEPTYANAPAAAQYLVAGRPGNLAEAIRWSADQYAAWGRLAGSVRSGLPAVMPTLHLGDDPERTRTFVLGMRHRALGMARGVLPFLDLGDARTLLDVGGGPGTYAMLLAQKYDELQIAVLDLPAVAEIARELIAEAGLSDRIVVRPGDALAEEYGDHEFDAVLFSGVLHQMGPAAIQDMLCRAHRALRPGGRVLISDMMVDGTKTQPGFSALFSLQMLLTSHEGAVFSEEECRAWMDTAGFRDITVRRLPPPLPYSVAIGLA